MKQSTWLSATQYALLVVLAIKVEEEEESVTALPQPLQLVTGH